MMTDFQEVTIGKVLTKDNMILFATPIDNGLAVFIPSAEQICYALNKVKQLLGPNYFVGGAEYPDAIEDGIHEETEYLLDFLSRPQPVIVNHPERLADGLTRIGHLIENDARISKSLDSSFHNGAYLTKQIVMAVSSSIYEQLI